MEKLKSTAKSIWAKIPKTKSEFKDLFDKCLSFLEHLFHKIWAFLKSAYVWIIKFYQEHSKLIHKILKSGLSLFLAGLLCLWFYGFIILAFDFIELYKDPKQESWSSQLRMAAFILVAWFGAPFLVWRTWIASKQANTAQEKAYTELFTKAVEQLGSEKPAFDDGKEKYVPNIEVRVGALYALERIMKDSDKDAPAIIDTLSTYIKQNCGKPKIFENEIPEDQLEKLSEDEIKTKRDEFIETLKDDPPANRYDIQTALKIIGRRPPNYKTTETKPDLTKVNLQGADLVNFNLSLCDLANAHLEGAYLQQANLQWANLQGADLERANLQGANLRWAELERAYLLQAELQGANLHQAELQGAYLQKAYLQGAELLGAGLQKAYLQDAYLQGANLRWAYLRDVQITDAHKTAASVYGVNFTKAKYDFEELQEQLKDMFGHKTLTTLPEGMKIPDHWSEADMDTLEGHEQYEREWEAFKKEKGVE